MEQEDAVLHILDPKIQKQRLNDMKSAAKRRNILVSDIFNDRVTHVITEFSDIGGVLRKLGYRDRSELNGVEVVSVQWFTDSMRAGRLITIEDRHRIALAAVSQPVERPVQQAPYITDYACQRTTPLKHHNEIFTRALEVLEKYAELRDNDQDYSRALAFRRASCVLKSLPHCLTSLQQICNITHMGNHSKSIIQEILEDGYSTEVDAIERDPWFNKMKLFTGVFGIGPSTSKKLIEKGWRTIQEVRENYKTKHWRVQYGLTFYEDLSLPVSRSEAEYILSIVKSHLVKVLPGAIVKLTGGFSRGKTTGHDVDILITHPVENRTNGVLPRLLESLHSTDLTLHGTYEHGTYTDEVLTTNSKLSMRGQLDHFEKWIGVIKVPKSVRNVKNLATVEANGVVDGDGVDDDGVGGGDGDGGVVNKGKGYGKSKNSVGAKSGGKDLSEKISGVIDSGAAKDSEKSEGVNADDTQTRKDKCVTNDNADANGTKASGTDRNHADGNGSTSNAPALNSSLDTPLNVSCPDHPILVAQEERTWIARRLDLIVSPYSQYYYALVGWIGSKQFNRDLRTYSERELKMKLSSHGLYDFTKGRKVPAASEKEVFDNLKLKYINPEDRNC